MANEELSELESLKVQLVEKHGVSQDVVMDAAIATAYQANKRMAEQVEALLEDCEDAVETFREELEDRGFDLKGEE